VTKHSTPPELYLPIDTARWLPGVCSENTPYLEIWPMSFYDEILLRNPDGLMNGKSIETVIKNCVPAIKNPGLIPESDYRYIFTAITLATNGEKATFNSACSKCKEFNQYELDIQQMLIEYQTAPIPEEFRIDDLIFSVKEIFYQDLVEYRSNSYGLSKSISNLQKRPEQSFDVAKLQKEINHYRTNELLLKTKKINSISSENFGSVTDSGYILQFLKTADKQIMQQVNAHLDQKQRSNRKEIVCSDCNHKNKVQVEIDPADQFFSKLVNTNDEEIEDLFKGIDKEIDKLHKEIANLVWYMRGSVSYQECMHMSPREIRSLQEQIKENLENSKKIGVPLI